MAHPQEMLERESDAFTSSAAEHRETTVEETAARIGSDPANDFILGAFLDGALVGTAGLYHEQGPEDAPQGARLGV